PTPTAWATVTATPPPTPTPIPTEPYIIPAIVDIQGKTINLDSTRTFFAKIRLPSGYDIDNIRCESIECVGAQASECQKDKKKLKVNFNIQDLANLDVDANETQTIELAVTGELTDGTLFTGSDMAKVKGKNDVPDGTGRIYGKVVSGNDLLEGATVTIKRKTFKEERTTNASGDFSFENLTWGRYMVTAEKEGYKKSAQAPKLSEKDDDIYITIELQKKK
ncbi:MAG TPA: carboxypeptidase-like regulatory domain-containing protein, partial [Candidatus Wunengus sp. YC63]|uniref:carboxypeptidase-like regulatory domain-containing protein n=1 Tax=Candidatus Wunengus sp. YC63 TaxID=3367699 RepID=UPI004027C67F